ncbi:MAG: DUF1189 family protein [Patescibacteria group bacterium]|uniref:DUF1189 family protein n=1 Tax=candidate division WWE3 bacterium TaxID=2053526 RepID=A0A955EB32_UNCKA|nr:DUF1189 family protein [candidate division WWE3 bacterium]
MKQVKAFAYIFYKSITSLDYYKDVVNSEIGLSVKYYLSLAVIASFLTAGVIAGRITPNIQDSMDKFIVDGKALYPQDLVITVKSGKLSINQPEPYIVKAPKFTQSLKQTSMETHTERSDAIEKIELENLVVFDANGELKDLETYKTLAVINSTNIIVRDFDIGRDVTNIFPIKDLPEGTFARKDFELFVQGAQNTLAYLPVFILGAMFFALFFYFGLMRLVYFLYVGGFVWLIGKIRGFDLLFTSAYKISLHTFTAVLALEVVMIMLGVDLALAMWGFLLNLTLSIVALFWINKK